MHMNPGPLNIKVCPLVTPPEVNVGHEARSLDGDESQQGIWSDPLCTVGPIIVPISVSASPSAHSTSASTSYTSSEFPYFNTDSSAATSPTSTQSTLATWGRVSRKHVHIILLKLPPPGFGASCVPLTCLHERIGERGRKVKQPIISLRCEH